MPAWSARGCARALALVLLALAGCASLPPPQDSPAPPAMELAAVPFFPQEDYQCGPAALATLLQAAGIARTPQDLVDHVYLPQRQGSLQPEIARRLAPRRRAALRPAQRAEDLLREVAAGHPVLVLQDVGWPLVPRWHYAVVVGYDLGARTLILRSGTVRRMVMAFDAFDRSWAKGGRWAFVALPPDRLPATAREADFVAAAAALERVAPPAAARAYAEALRAWPANLFARMALGNAAYRERRLESARVTSGRPRRTTRNRRCVEQPRPGPVRAGPHPRGCRGSTSCRGAWRPAAGPLFGDAARHRRARLGHSLRPAAHRTVHRA
jgi:hypothetical protein